MMTCNRIQRLIDEADKAEALPFVAASHLADCPACNRFAEERTKVRAFLSEMPRINAPTNFDALLKMRLAESKATRSFSWFTPVFAMRFGAVAAVALIAVLSAPYLSNGNVTPQTASSFTAGVFIPDRNAIRLFVEEVETSNQVNENGFGRTTVAAYSALGRGRRMPSAPKSINDFAVDGTPIIIQVDERETLSVPMMPVSVGAQQQMMMRSSRSAPKSLAVSF